MHCDKTNGIVFLHIINFNNLCFRVENETTLISAKNRVDLSSISEVKSYITEWPRFFGPPCRPIACVEYIRPQTR